MDYIITKANTIEDLNDQVVTLLGSGWVPQGGVATSFNQYTGLMEYIQALVKS